MNGLISATAFLWAGMVAGVSFLEAPLKFRAPGITLQLGLGIGRLVFAALSRVEMALLTVIVLALVFGDPAPGPVWATATAGLLLAAQLVLVRPALTRRSDRVLAGDEGPRSPAHQMYILLEVGKMAVLIGLGVSALGVS